MIDVSASDVAWRCVDDGTLVVHRTSAAMWHLNAVADSFESVAARLRSGNRPDQPRARVRRITDVGDVISSLELARDGFVRHVGSGVLWCAPDGRVSMFTNETAAIWDRLALGSATFVTLCDLVADRFECDNEAAERRTSTALVELSRAGAIEGLHQLVRFRSSAPGLSPETKPSSMLGVLAAMQAATPPHAVFSGMRPILTAAGQASPPAHVAVVCQYGIAGLAPGVDDYVRNCIYRLEQLRPDLVILTGGGRHGRSAAREAESVIARYLAQMPGRAIWLDRHSETTWENLQHSLEMLSASSILPRRISFVGDRARTEKLRLCCWLARQRFPEFRRVTFCVVPLRRARFTWRDRRAAQLIAGCLQAIRDYRASSPAVRMHS